MTSINDCGVKMASAESLQCDHQAMNQLSHLGGNLWEARDGDPQFLLTFPLPQGAGVYRITAMLQADAPMQPCLYMDLGEGWSESTCLRFEREADGARWTSLACLAGIAGPARFDPMEHAGPFRFDGVVIERLAESEAILMLLRRCIMDKPDMAAVLVHEAFERTASDGFLRCCRWLMSRCEKLGPAPDATRYVDWIERFDTLSCEQLRAMHGAIARLPRRPLISLILPIDGASTADQLRTCIDSVLDQAYPDWELCLIDETSSDPDVQCLLETCVERNSRIRLLRRGCVEGVGSAWESVLALLQGQFVGVLDQNPKLSRHALFAFADSIVRHPDAKLFYSDEDRIESSGRRVDPYFKPDWNPELFLSQDFLNPLAVYDVTLVRGAGGLTVGSGCIPSRALAQRCIGKLEQEQIVHIPLVLSHLPFQDEPGQASEDREDVSGSEAIPVSDGYQASRALPLPPPKVSLIIPTRDRLDLLRRCIDSIISLTTYPDYEIIIVDNQSSEAATLDYFSSLTESRNVRVLAYDAPFNYSAINNFAVGRVDGVVIGLINNDVEVISPDWLEQMVPYAIAPKGGAVGAMLYYPDDTIQHAGVMLGLGGVAGHPYSRQPRGALGQRGRARSAQNLSAITGACLLVARERYLEVGGLNEQLTVAFNDVDFCLKLLAHGYRNVWTPFAELYHHESASRGSEDTLEKKARFKSEVDYMIQTWGDRIRNDPGYNPNLSLRHGDAFALASEPRYGLSQWMGELSQIYGATASS